MKVKDANEIILGGSIVWRQESRSIVSIRVATDAYAGRSAFPTVIFYNKELTQNFKVGDRVTIKAHIQARRTLKSDGVTKAYYQDIVGDEINHTKRLLLEYLDAAIIPDPEGGYADDVNKAFFVGRIVHQYAPREDIQILTLACKSRSSVDYVEITCFKRQAELAALMEEGDMVAIVGSVRTSPSKKDERITNENIICKDIAAIPSEEE